MNVPQLVVTIWAVSGEDVGRTLFGAAVAAEEILAWLIGGGGLIALGTGVKWVYDKWAKDEETSITRMEKLLARTDAELATVKKESRAEIHALRNRCNVVELRLARCETWIRLQPNYPKWVDLPIEAGTSDTDSHPALEQGGDK